MSIESTGETAEVFRNRNEIDGCKQRIRDSTVSQKEDIQKWALCLENLTKLNKREGPISKICAEITHHCKSEFGWTDNQCDYIRRVLDDRFKDHRFDHINKGGTSPSLENLNMIESGHDLKSLSNEELVDFYQKICTDKHKNKQEGEKIHTMQYRVKQIADERALTLFDEYTESVSEQIENSRLTEEKILINDINVTSEIDDKSTQVNFNKLIESLSSFRDNFMRINKKMERYPLTDDNVRRGLNYYILDFKTRIDAINNILQSLANDKGTLSPRRWNLVKGFLEHETLGGLASMLKQMTLSGKPHKPTTKGIKEADTKKYEEYDKAVDLTEFKKFALSIRLLIHHLDNWYDCTSPYPIVRATHQEMLHDKRSDSANWRKGCETSEYLDFSIDKLKEQNGK